MADETIYWCKAPPGRGDYTSSRRVVLDAVIYNLYRNNGAHDIWIVSDAYSEAKDLERAAFGQVSPLKSAHGRVVERRWSEVDDGNT